MRFLRPILLLPVVAALALVGCDAEPPPPTTDPDGDVRAITFPVEGDVDFIDSWGAPRSGGRSHKGTDLMGDKMQKLVAAADGTITWMKHTNSGSAGNYLVITDEDGWEYWYLHINNDRPGTDDGSNIYDNAFAPGIRRGSKVKAGDHIAYLGDSGNAEWTGAQLHFEMHRPDGVAINPYPSLVK